MKVMKPQWILRYSRLDKLFYKSDYSNFLQSNNRLTMKFIGDDKLVLANSDDRSVSC